MNRLARLFRPMDTTAADAAIDRLAHSTKAVHVRARALRMDIGCGDCGETADRVNAFSGRIVSQFGRVLRDLHASPVREPLPADIQGMLDRI